VFRLSKLTDYAVVVLGRLAREGAVPGGQVQTAPGLALATGIAEPTVAKVLKILGQAGLVEGVRGARGGYRLTRPLAALPLSEVIFAFDGPIALTACVDGVAGLCEAEGICQVRGRWDPVNDAIRNALSGITVADIAAPRPVRQPLAPAPALAQLVAE
jgi:FeS assembly SUF system regulator